MRAPRTLLVLMLVVGVAHTLTAQDATNGRRRCEWEGWLPPDSGRARVRRAAHLDVAGEAVLRARLGDGSSRVRDAAARTLAAGSDPRTVDALVHALADSSGIVRDGVARSLGRIGDGRAIPALRTLARSSSKHDRQAAVWALGQIGSGDAEAALLEASRDTSKHVRAEAAWALGFMSTTGSAKRVAELTTDPEPSIRQAAVCSAASLIRRRTPASASLASAVDRARRDADVQVRDAAAWARLP